MTTLDVNSLPFEEKPLHVPSLEEIQQVLNSGLPENFESVEVEVVDCPNLTLDPFNLAGPGLCGSTTYVEVGGPPYLIPVVDKSKIYDIKDLLLKCNKGEKESNIFAVGPAAGPHIIRNTNCEGIYNINIAPSGSVCNHSYTAKVDGAEEKCVLEKLPNSETRFALMACLFVSEGKPGKVLRVRCKKRIGSLNYFESIRKTLENYYKEQCVGLGGIFLLKNGKAKMHVMRDFSKTPITSEEELNNWLKFYDMPAVLNSVGTMVTTEHDLDLRLYHFHSFSNTNWGGHYHYDVTPDVVEYEGYFNVAESVIRVDKPQNTHKLGRD